MARDLKARKPILFIGVIVGMAIITTLFLICTAGLDKSAAHTHYTAQECYGKGNYVYSTVTFSGSGMKQETVVPIKKIEELAYDKKLALGYENKYSLLTSGSVFSTKKFTGIKLYDLLLYLGMDKNQEKDTNVTVVSSDGYTVSLTIGELRESNYGRYESISTSSAVEDNLPVLLSFGSDGVPLVGPTGNEAIDKKISVKEGFDKNADNVGGPIRLTIGQKASNEYNAPLNAKWVREIIVGQKTAATLHDGNAGKIQALQVTLHKETSEGVNNQCKRYTLHEVEGFAQSDTKNMARNYYGEKNFFEGADLWRFLRYKAGVTAQEGSVKFTFLSGGTETLSLEYLRNLRGNYDSYITQKSGLRITSVKPALGYSINGQATLDCKLYALLPADGKEKDAATIKEIKSIDVYVGHNWTDQPNPNKNTELSIAGKGIKESTSVTVGYLEDQTDLVTTSGDFMGVRLLGLLQELGLAVDASKITLSNGKEQVVLTLEELKKNKNETILATRRSGVAMNRKQGPVALRGSQNLDNVTSVIVDIEPGQWIHTGNTYQDYLDTTITISGSQAKATRTYTLKQVEELGGPYTVKEHFAAGGGGNAYQGAILRKLIADNLKSGIKIPKRISVIGKDGYAVDLSVADVFSGVESNYQPGETRDIILAYSIDGTPLVPFKTSKGYTGNNAFGPLRLIVENQTAKWVKNVAEIRLGN